MSHSLYKSESKNEPNRTDILKNESNPKRLFESSVEPDDLGSVCVYGSSEF